jgi:hypothetical protein
VADTELICLANSKKPGGRCIAGVTLDRQWVRPLGDTPDGSVLSHERRLDNGREPALLDQMVVPLRSKRPSAYQPENWRIGNRPWRFVRHLSDAAALKLLTRLASTDPVLFCNTTDRIPCDELGANPAAASLVVVQPRKLVLTFGRNARGTRQIRAEFLQMGQRYDLSMTDPVFADRLGAQDDGDQVRAAALLPRSDIFLTISLAEPWRGDCYKIVAGVIIIPQ